MLLNTKTRKFAALLLAGALAAPMPALADVKAGVDAWSRGDYTAAVREWQGPAAAGDPDAMFNLAQAYRLGRGVAADPARAEQLYAQAAARGHLQAADTYGLMLFQNGRREEALPYVRDAARRGDPRSQYLLGIAHFNGDLVEKDWVRAYALLTLANSQGLPQAAPAIAQMDQHIPLEQRQQGVGLAQTLQQDADAARAREMAAAELGTGPAIAAAPPGPQPVPSASNRVPQPVQQARVSPSVATAEAAIEEAGRATGMESPADAGASYARANTRPAVTPAPAPAPAPVRVATPTPTPAPAPAPVRVATAPAPAPAANRTSGPWKVQLGAFGVRGNAERLWARLSSRSEISGRERLLIPAGRVTKLQAGGYASRAEAEAACRSLKRSGQECLVTR
ncbi:SPOR domain-containing protein [Paraurantiacibacter namhicola]|uniref:Rare lipoprotein A n=1 Tax=Paraurantiacibacter namhicola TaxID=645517 RepID=A0A1C7DB49_9SPHN|nr:SPOR domain-containing protein [Paraurantiacibacter namhicola]ANU08674.1 rare lipoprotein A [Paraurantiacibacter namhicola]